MEGPHGSDGLPVFRTHSTPSREEHGRRKEGKKHTSRRELRPVRQTRALHHDVGDSSSVEAVLTEERPRNRQHLRRCAAALSRVTLTNHLFRNSLTLFMMHVINNI